MQPIKVFGMGPIVVLTQPLSWQEHPPPIADCSAPYNYACQDSWHGYYALCSHLGPFQIGMADNALEVSGTVDKAEGKSEEI